jgi:hypothetical protein
VQSFFILAFFGANLFNLHNEKTMLNHFHLHYFHVSPVTVVIAVIIISRGAVIYQLKSKRERERESEYSTQHALELPLITECSFPEQRRLKHQRNPQVAFK